MNRSLVALGGLTLLVLAMGVAVGATGTPLSQADGDGPLGNLTQANETVSEANLSENVTVVNLGENVSTNVVQTVNASEPTVFVGPNVLESTNASTAPNVSATEDGIRINVTQEYVLGGEISGWTGDAPESISAARNPNLSTEPGEVYAITWVNVDGRAHGLAIANANGTVVAETTVVSETGAAQTLVFRVPEDPGQYYCVIHTEAMRGNVVLAQSD